MPLTSKLSALSAEEIKEIQDVWHECHAEILIKNFRKSRNREEWNAYISKNPPSPETIALLIVLAVEQHQSKRGQVAANALHSKPGGSRDKVKQIRKLWASGNFKDRDTCAEQECAALDMSFSSARKALRNAPAPDPWPAKETRKRR
jgi:hypothetical protein